MYVKVVIRNRVTINELFWSGISFFCGGFEEFVISAFEGVVHTDLHISAALTLDTRNQHLRILAGFSRVILEKNNKY